MALKLKKLGYDDVTIFEKSGRVGGKSYDVQFRGSPYPMGTIFLDSTYFDNVVSLAREYNVGEILTLPPAGMWTSNQGGNNITRAEQGFFRHFNLVLSINHLDFNDLKLWT